MSAPAPDPVLKSARREACLVLFLWLAAMLYSIGYCWRWGYGRSPEEVTFILGIPDWIFWGVFAPWCVCWVVSLWFSYFYMEDADLGEERPDDAPDAEEFLHG